ncbi:hypothetical protein EGR_08039 [Echinococcus granulosus]|uniref:Uncharacterized protein n=1 Tax=Echinococcus granulosus TaxID=6210 RepID=W6U9A2_ECHGR|nr:hypothetical protein EGR_08039 [Echinococcus granulosus]EUB57091.1 hypothetical protein EGR_08039 [Echinococcus granulosus]
MATFKVFKVTLIYNVINVKQYVKQLKKEEKQEKIEHILFKSWLTMENHNILRISPQTEKTSHRFKQNGFEKHLPKSQMKILNRSPLNSKKGIRFLKEGGNAEDFIFASFKRIYVSANFKRGQKTPFVWRVHKQKVQESWMILIGLKVVNAVIRPITGQGLLKQ